MGFSRILRFFSVVLVTSALSATAFASDDEALAFWKREKSQADIYLKSFHPLGTLHIQDLFQLRRKGQWIELVSRTGDMEGNTPRMATFDDIAGAAEVYVHRKPGEDQIDRFELNLMDFPSERRVVESRVQLEADKGKLTISRTVQNNGVTQQIGLEQSRRTALGPSNFITLSVSTSSLANGQSEQLAFSSPDFTSFMQDRPDETTKYLRPLLRELNQEMLFAPDLQLAEQVFGALRRVEPAIQKQVAELLPMFNEQSYRVRNIASTKLKALGRPAADVLERMDRSAMSPEQNLRIDSFLAHYSPLSAKDITRLRKDPTFLLDCLYSDKSEIRWAALDQIRNLFNPTLDFDPDAPEEARGFAIANLRRHLTPGY